MPLSWTLWTSSNTSFASFCAFSCSTIWGRVSKYGWRLRTIKTRSSSEIISLMCGSSVEWPISLYLLIILWQCFFWTHYKKVPLNSVHTRLVSQPVSKFRTGPYNTILDIIPYIHNRYTYLCNIGFLLHYMKGKMHVFSYRISISEHVLADSSQLFSEWSRVEVGCSVALRLGNFVRGEILKWWLRY